ncbi:4-hydroxyacetophenone monooxygenase [Alphaproteobacteria bacterium SO-S41]|nr:4-hydroxyacetophenone monooxygenase [Alphaproteobacteria bacterium SO-S41]
MEAELDRALATAHTPTLMMALVHLTGDTSHIDNAPPLVYEMTGDGNGNLAPALQDEVKAKVKAALLAHKAGKPLAPVPNTATLRKMMNYVAGVEIPPHYVPFLEEELAIDGRDPKQPAPIAPKLKGRAMKVLIIGAGMSGILTALRLKQAGVDFQIVEKNPNFGGTWLENLYPGCRVDNPSHMYSYSFEDNHVWPYLFSTQPVLLAYFQGVAKRHDLAKHVRFDTHVNEARFDEAANEWRVTVTGKDGKQEVLTATAVVSAVGQLNQPNYPAIEGVGAFKGPTFHSARWDHSVELKGKDVAVIGTGASAFQFVPAIAPDVAHMSLFQRTPPWLSPTLDYHNKTDDGMNWLIQNLPFYDKWYRFWLFWMGTDGVYEAMKIDPEWADRKDAVSPLNHELRTMFTEMVKMQLHDRPDLIDKVIPDYPLGGKRMVRDNGVWLDALKRENVDLVTDKIARIVAEGVETADGKLHKADVLIYGTGFKASSFLDTYKVVGRGGKELHEEWAGDARAYLGMTAPGFPNFFILYGPNTNIVVNGSIIFFSECSVRYVVGALDLLAETGAATMEVKKDVHDAFNARVDEGNAKMAWGSPNVMSWYKNALGRVSQNWPFPNVEYWQATLKPNPDDFILDGGDATKAKAA